MINVGRYIDTYPGTHFHRWPIVNHLLTLSGNHVDDFFGARMVMPRMPFSQGEFNNSETEALCTGNNRFAEEVGFSPVKFHTINISRRGDNAGSKSLHKGESYLFISRKNGLDQAIFRGVASVFKTVFKVESSRAFCLEGTELSKPGPA